MTRWKTLSGPVIAAALLSWVACTDAPIAGPEGPMFKKGDPVVNPPPATVNGPVWVIGNFSFIVGGGGGGGAGAGINAHPQGKGRCGTADGGVSEIDSENTYWYSPGGDQKTGAKFCAGDDDNGGGGSLVVCTLDPIPATYAFGGAGGPPADPQNTMNENLNFLSDEEELQPDLFVHYNARQNATTGKGELAVSWTCTDATFNGSGTIDLSQFDGSGNMFLFLDAISRQLDVSSGITIVNDDAEGSDYDLDDLYWEYRSRVPN